jgi:transaldolase
MNATQQLHELGQSLWLDNITRGLLNSGALAHYIRDFAITGLTSNPTIFEHAIGNTDFYDEAIRVRAEEGASGEDLFFELALEDLRRAADLFGPVFNETGGIDGWVSLEVSPLLADDAAKTIAAAANLHARARRPNLFIKIPGTPEGLVAIEESIFAGIPINVTLLFSRAQYLAAAEAYIRGIERRIAAGLDPNVGSVASLFVSRWDAAVHSRVPEALNNRLGIAVATLTYRAYRELLASARWQRLAAAGARAQRLLWASTGTKDPAAADTLYVEAAGGARYRQHHAGKDAACVRRPRQVRAAFEPLRAATPMRCCATCCRLGIEENALAALLQREGAACVRQPPGTQLARRHRRARCANARTGW